MSMTRQRPHLRFGSSPFTQTSAKAPTSDDLRGGKATLQLGHKGEAVRRVQLLLGLTDATAYAATTLTAVKRFQQEHKLPTNGLVDRATFNALEKYAPAAAVALTPLAQRVKDILTSREIGTNDKIAQVWKAFTEGVTSEYGTAIYSSRGISIERRSTTSWVVLLLKHAHMSAPDKAAPPFTDLVKAVILNDPSSCQNAYLYLSDEAKRSLLDNAEYENALFSAAEKQGTSDPELLFLKQLIQLRFAHITKIERSSESSSPMWEASTLRRIYELMKALPAHHLTQIKNLCRAPQKASDHAEDGIVAGEFDPRKGILNVRAAPSATPLADPGLTNVNLFDFSIRHEIGHAVDSLLLARHRLTLPKEDPLKSNHLNYYSQVPGVSDPDWRWVYYDNYIHLFNPPGTRGFLELIQEMMANSAPPDERPPEAVSLDEFASLIYLKSNTNEITTIIENGVTSTRTHGREYDSTLRELATKLGLGRRELERRLENHRVYKALTDRSALEKPFTQGTLSARTTFGDRVFVRPYNDEFASFSAAAFRHSVRQYGARGPSEWFAETYSLYNDPRGINTLKSKHPNAINYLKGLLHRLE